MDFGVDRNQTIEGVDRDYVGGDQGGMRRAAMRAARAGMQE
jgi:hypothetical protein